MIRDARVLQDDFLPQEIVHRDQEMNMLTDALQPAVDGDRPEDAFLVGPSGAGRTCIARACVEKLEEQSFGVVTHHVDCWQHPSPSTRSDRSSKAPRLPSISIGRRL